MSIIDRMESRNEESVLREIPDLDTLHELLARLNEAEHFQPVSRSENITVEDVAEALHLDPDHVANELEMILTEHREARITGVLRELEEPLYRVERTGHTAPDPLGNPLFKLRSVQILAERNRDKSVLPRRKVQETNSDKLGQHVGRFMVLLIAVLFAVLGIKLLIVMVLQR